MLLQGDESSYWDKSLKWDRALHLGDLGRLVQAGGIRKSGSKERWLFSEKRCGEARCLSKQSCCLTSCLPQHYASTLTLGCRSQSISHMHDFHYCSSVTKTGSICVRLNLPLILSSEEKLRLRPYHLLQCPGELSNGISFVSSQCWL